MSIDSTLSNSLVESEVADLIKWLSESSRRLEELTGGEVDAVISTDGRAYVLQRAQENGRSADAAKQASILNALPANIALIDSAGVILSVNDAWRQFGKANFIPGPADPVGINYLEVCDRACGIDAAQAGEAAAGIRAVLSGALKTYSLEYSCDSPAEVRWFQMTVSPLEAMCPAGAVLMHVDVTARKQIETELRQSESRFLQMTHAIRDAFFLCDADSSQMYYVSPAYEKIWGRTCDSLYRHPSSWMDAIHADDRARIAGHFAQCGVLEFDDEFRVVRPDGGTRWVHMRMVPVPADCGTPRRIAGVASDATARKEAAIKIKRLNRGYAVLSGISSLIVRARDRDELFREACRIAVEVGEFRLCWIGVVDRAQKKVIPFVSAGADAGFLETVSDRLDLRYDAPRGHGITVLAVDRQTMMVVNDVALDPRVTLKEPHAARGIKSMVSLPLVVAGETVAVFDLHASDIDYFDADEQNLLRELADNLAFAIDSISRRTALDFLAYYDEVTGLANSRLFRDRLTQLVSRSSAGNHAALYLIDIDHFTRVNDSLGRRAGDNLLLQVAHRLQQQMSKASNLSRISGDTFAVSIGDLGAASDASLAILKDQVFGAFQESFHLDGRELRVSARAGIALFPDDGPDADTLFKNAEAALHRAKNTNERYVFYAPAMNARIVEKQSMENLLQSAVEREQLVLHYQPKVDLSSGMIVGSEALLRWNHPDRGLLTPVDFLADAEESDVILAIGEWVLSTACAQVRKWQEVGLPATSVAVNVSARQFWDDAMVSSVANALGASGIDPKLLEIELTENIVMHDAAKFVEKLVALKALGITLSLDDFGTGYSSLSYLKRFHLDRLKIDQSFVNGVVTNPDDAAIVRAILAVGHSLGLEVIAEGVETAAQVEWLRRERCEQIQGYFFSPPIPATEFETMVRSRKRLDDPGGPKPGEARTLLLVDDEPNVLAAVVRALRSDGYRVLTALSAAEALTVLALNTVQVVMCDHRMPQMTGTELLAKVKLLYPDTVRLLFSGYIEIDALVDAVNRGAVYRFLLKPWDDDILRENIREAFRYYWLTRKHGSAPTELPMLQVA